MKVSVYDTYLVKDQNTMMHFDILVAQGTTDEKVFAYGQAYLKMKNLSSHSLTSAQCGLCHIEEASQVVKNDINKKGFHIIEMENCN
jgi:hypothetical protein